MTVHHVVTSTPFLRNLTGGNDGRDVCGLRGRAWVCGRDRVQPPELGAASRPFPAAWVEGLQGLRLVQFCRTCGRGSEAPQAHNLMTSFCSAWHLQTGNAH